MLVSEYCSNCDKKTMRKTSECPECTPKNVEAQNSTSKNKQSNAIEILKELVDLIQSNIDGEYEFDSLTLQPAREYLNAINFKEHYNMKLHKMCEKCIGKVICYEGVTVNGFRCREFYEALESTPSDKCLCETCALGAGDKECDEEEYSNGGKCLVYTKV